MKKISLFFLLILCSSGLYMATEPVSSQTTTIVLKVGAQTSPTLVDLVKDYNANHTKGQYVVKIDEGTFETDSQLQGYTSRLQAQDSSFDVFAMDVIWPANLSEYLVDLSDVFPATEQSKFLPAAVESDTWNNSVYAVPWFHDSGMLYYRTDVLQYAADQGIISSANPPATQQELHDMAITLSTNQNIKDKFGAMDGFVWQGAAYEGLMCDFVEYMGGFGQHSFLTTLANGTTISNIDTTEVNNTLSYMKSLIDDGASPVPVLSFNEETARSIWDSGDAIFMRNWPYAYKLSLLSDNLNGVNDGTNQQQFSVAPMPRADAGVSNALTSALGGWGLAINKYSNHITESADLIMWLTQEAQQIRLFAGNGNLPTRIAAYDSAKLTAAGAVDQTYIVDFLPSFTVAIPRPVYPNYFKLSSLLWQPMHDAISGATSIDEAITTMDTTLTTALYSSDTSVTSSSSTPANSSSVVSTPSVSVTSGAVHISAPAFWFMVAIIPVVIINRRKQY